MNRQDIKELVLLISKLSKYYKQNRNFLQILIFYRKSRVQCFGIDVFWSNWQFQLLCESQIPNPIPIPFILKK